MFFHNLIRRFVAAANYLLHFWKTFWSKPKFRLLLCVFVVAVIFVVQILFFQYPNNFPTRTLVTIPSGKTLNQIAEIFRENRLISSPFLFKVIVALLDNGSGAKSGDYFFEQPQGVFVVGRRVASADYGLEPERITIPEGTNIKEIGALLKDKLDGFFNDASFVELAAHKEGYLFPDTYFVLQNIRPSEFIKMMEDNFAKKISAIEPAIDEFGKPLKDVIIMASLLEEEARQIETRRTIAGILWKRLKLGMPLQVDAVFPYINGKNTYQLTVDDLQIDSPYNTYKYRGLPPGPITNPGLSSIESAVTPIESKYLYYLSDRQGRMHYAVTHDEHVANKERYLR